MNWRARSAGSSDVTTPEELLAAAHASCFAMAFSHSLSESGHSPGSLDVEVTVAFEPGKGVLRSDIVLRASGSDVPPEEFAALAEDAKENCPIFQALRIPVFLEATLT
jgi:osmotically inducible protein OsmC